MQKLINVQMALQAPKGQHNNFGNYDYRSAEDILNAVKPLLQHECLTMTITDELVNIGDRYYIKATVQIKDVLELIAETTAYAREALFKKGMDEAQITGSASSYARKYALNGMFLIDDVKDADTHDNRNNVTKVKQTFVDNPRATPQQVNEFINYAKGYVLSTDQMVWLIKLESGEVAITNEQITVSKLDIATKCAVIV